MAERGSKGYMTTAVLLADGGVCVGVCWREQNTPSEATVRWSDEKLLSTDTGWDEVLSVVAGLYLEPSESSQ